MWKVVGLVVVLGAVVGAPVGNAIVHGTVDTVHTFAGAIAIHRLDGSFGLFCSGSLVSPRVFLTAGHCTYMLSQADVTPDRLFVSFALKPLEEPGSWNHVSYYLTHPEFRVHVVNAGMVDSHDLGVMVLSGRVENVSPGVLAPVGFLEGLDLAGNLQVHSTQFTSVGYGAGENFQPTLERMSAVSGFQALLDAFLQLTQNNMLGFGGTCAGDSGGPSLYNDAGSEVIVAVTSWGDAHCVATNTVYRVDTVGAMSFIQQEISKAS